MQKETAMKTERNKKKLTVTLKVHSADQFRDELPSTEVFDMSDCSVSITAPWDSSVEDLDGITKFIASVINVIDTQVEFGSHEGIVVVISETPFSTKNLK